MDLGPAAPVADAVRRWRARYGTDRPPPADGKPDPGAELRKLVWDKLAPHLGGAKTVLVSPDGPLTGLPFASLLTQDSQRVAHDMLARINRSEGAEPNARDAIRSTSVYFGSPGSVDAGYPASASAAAGTARIF